MAKNKNTYEKRRKELKRMQKAQDKRERRLARRAGPAETLEPGLPETTPEADAAID